MFKVVCRGVLKRGHARLFDGLHFSLTLLFHHQMQFYQYVENSWCFLRWIQQLVDGEKPILFKNQSQIPTSEMAHYHAKSVEINQHYLKIRYFHVALWRLVSGSYWKHHISWISWICGHQSIWSEQKMSRVFVGVDVCKNE